MYRHIVSPPTIRPTNQKKMPFKTVLSPVVKKTERELIQYYVVKVWKYPQGRKKWLLEKVTNWNSWLIIGVSVFTVVGERTAVEDDNGAMSSTAPSARPSPVEGVTDVVMAWPFKSCSSEAVGAVAAARVDVGTVRTVTSDCAGGRVMTGRVVDADRTARAIASVVEWLFFALGASPRLRIHNYIAAVTGKRNITIGCIGCATVLLFSKLNCVFLDTSIYKIFCVILEITNCWGDLNDVSAENEQLFCHPGTRQQTVP